MIAVHDPQSRTITITGDPANCSFVLKTEHRLAPPHKQRIIEEVRAWMDGRAKVLILDEAFELIIFDLEAKPDVVVEDRP